MSSMKTTRTPEDWAKVDPLYLMQRVARGETSGTAAYNLMRDALADIASLAQRRRELEEKLEKAHQATNDECMDWAREYERRKDAEAECDTLRAELAKLRRWEKEVRENSPLLIRLEAAESERAAYRAMLEGMEVFALDMIAKDTPERARMTGRDMAMIARKDRQAMREMCCLVVDVIEAAGLELNVDEKKLPAAIRSLRAEVERLRQPAARYEHVRRLNPNQFGNLWQRNIMTGIPFDKLVDEDMGASP